MIGYSLNILLNGNIVFYSILIEEPIDISKKLDDDFWVSVAKGEYK